MDVVAPIRHFRLAAPADRLGLRCERDGLFLGGVPLLRQTPNGFVPRATTELGALFSAAYGEVIALSSLSRGLRGVAEALNRGDPSLAMIAAVHLQLPELDDAAAQRIESVDKFLAKYDPDEPRDWRGRWTTGGGAGPATAGAVSAERQPNAAPDGRALPRELGSESGGNGSGSEITDVTPDTIDPAAYNGRYHDQVVADEAANLRSAGEIVLTEVKLEMADGSAAARIDILAFDPQAHIVYGVEVKTGDKPGFTPGQIVAYPHLMLGESVVATDPRVVALGLIPDFPLMPIPIYLIRQRNRHSMRDTIRIDPQKMSRYYMGKFYDLSDSGDVGG